MIKRIAAFAIVVLFLGWALLPIPLPGQDGAYNTTTGLIWCNNESACLHEAGHKMDHDAGWVSDREEFAEAVRIYMIVEWRYAEQPSDWASRIMAYPGLYSVVPGEPFRQTGRELYADMYRWSGGSSENMPEIFRRFYTWSEGAQHAETLH